MEKQLKCRFCGNRITRRNRKTVRWGMYQEHPVCSTCMYMIKAISRETKSNVNINASFVEAAVRRVVYGEGFMEKLIQEMKR